MDTEFLEKATADLLQRFDPGLLRKSLAARPFMVEFFGTPKSGKTTMKIMLEHFFKRNGMSVASEEEGAARIKWIKRHEPDYNFETGEYALSLARERAYGPGHRDFHVVIFDRGIYDCVTRMQYYVTAGKMTDEHRQVVENYFLLPHNRSLFDLHVCLVATPEVAMQREHMSALTQKHGETMNPVTLNKLLAAHHDMWYRHACDENPAMVWHDSTAETIQQTAASILRSALTNFLARQQKLEDAVAAP